MSGIAVTFAEIEAGWQSPQITKGLATLHNPIPAGIDPVKFSESHTSPTKSQRLDLHSRAERLMQTNPGMTYTEAAIAAEKQTAMQTTPKHGIPVSYESRKAIAARADCIQKANPSWTYEQCAIAAAG